MPRPRNSLWDQHAIVLSQGQGKSGAQWRCRYCSEIYNSTITRLIRHVSRVGGGGIGACEMVPDDVAEPLRAQHPELGEAGGDLHSGSTHGGRRRAHEEEEVTDDVPLPRSRMRGGGPPPADVGAAAVGPGGDGGAEASRATTSEMPLPGVASTSGAAAGSSMGGEIATDRPRPLRQQTISGTQTTLSWLRRMHDAADIQIGRTVVECNLSFSVLRTEQWKRMVRAIAACGPSDTWSGVDYRTMRTRWLDEEISRIQVSLTPLKEAWGSLGCSIVSDGWTDMRNRGVINILVSCALGTYFLRAVDASAPGTRVTGPWIYEHIRSAIMEVGVAHVVQVITDNASNCVRMGEMIEDEFPTIVWTPCAAHCMDLLMEDIGRLPWVSPIMRDAATLASFFRRRRIPLAIFRAHSPLDITRPSRTRFASMFLLLQRLQAVHQALRRTVVSAEWTSWEDSIIPESQHVQRLCLNADFWDTVESIVTTLQPIYHVLRMTDMEGCTMGLLYHFMRRIREGLGDLSTLDPDRLMDIQHIVEERWAFMHRPIHGMAALLHPLYRSTEIFEDPELEMDRNAYIAKVYSASEDDQMSLDIELSRYVDGTAGGFGRVTARRREMCVRPLDWWKTYGNTTPQLRTLAKRILSQDCSSSVAERNWSSYSLIHTRIRNKLTQTQLERLVFCRSNLRLLRRLRTSEGARQVNPDDIEAAAQARVGAPIERDMDMEEEQLFSMLQTELDAIDIRGTRSRTRARSAPASTTRRGTGGRRYRPRRGSRHGRGDGSGASTSTHVDVPLSDDDVHEDVPLRQPVYNTDSGHTISDGDFGSSPSEADEE